MNFNDAMEKALSQAREMQKQAIEAVNTAAEQMKPHIQKSLENARELQTTLNRHTAESSEIASRQAQTALGHVSEFIAMGSQAMRESAEQTRETAMKMVEESKKVVDAASAAVSKERQP